MTILTDTYVFIVGKSDPLDASVNAIRRAGYLVGIFQDQTITLKDPSIYDMVVPVDFAKLETLTAAEPLGLTIAGLLCTYENYVLAKAQIGATLGVPTLSIESARFCTDKVLMRQAFADYDVSLSPAFQEISSSEQAVQFAERVGFPVIVKPASLVKSLLVVRCDNYNQLVESVDSAFSQLVGLYKKYRVFDRKPKLIIEQFMEGTLYSVAAFADGRGDAMICPGITELTNANQVGFDDNFLYRRVLPAPIDSDLEERLFATAQKGIAALKLRSSPAHVELIHTTADEIKIIEIGARIGGYRPRMYNLSYGLDLHDIEVAITTDNEVPVALGPAVGLTAVYEIFPHQAGTFDALVPGAIVDKLPDLAYSAKTKIKPGSVCGPAKDGHKAAAIILVHDTNYETFKSKCSDIEEITVKLG